MELTRAQMEEQTRTSAWNRSTFAAIMIVQMWVAHAIAFFFHEYSHSTTAWLLGWKANPLALHYAYPTLRVVLLQRGIDENVNYAPIFASGHGWQAAIIAAAGMVVGNWLITYPLSLWGMGRARLRGARAWTLFFYWLCVASVGNFIDYVPVRTFASEDDMHTLVRGLQCTPWWILVALGIPSAVALAHLLFRIEPSVLRWLFPESAVRRSLVVLFTALALFGFYGASGISERDPPSHWMSVVSVCGFVPLTTVIGWWMVNRSPSTASH